MSPNIAAINVVYRQNQWPSREVEVLLTFIKGSFILSRKWKWQRHRFHIAFAYAFTQYKWTLRTWSNCHHCTCSWTNCHYMMYNLHCKSWTLDWCFFHSFFDSFVLLSPHRSRSRPNTPPSAPSHCTDCFFLTCFVNKKTHYATIFNSYSFSTLESR